MTAVARYLSESWFDEVNEAAGASASLKEATAGVRLVIQQVVTGGPDGEVRYWLRMEDGTVEGRLGDAEAAGVEPDATFTQSYRTAVAVSRGELRAEDALLAGRIRLRGDLGVLVRHQAALAGLADAFTDLRRRTEYP